MRESLQRCGIQRARRVERAPPLARRRGLQYVPHGGSVRSPSAHPRVRWAKKKTMTIIQGMTLRPAPAPQVQADQNAGAPAPALSEAVARAVRRYLSDMGTHPTEDLYRIVLAEVERPLLDEVLRHCRGNQSRASQMLGITRATLRKKLAERQAARRKA